MIITYVFADSTMEFNTSNWRCMMPHNAINKTKEHKSNLIHLNEFINNSENSQKFCQESDIIIVERNLFGDTNTMLQFWKGRNKILVANFDDAYPFITPSNIAYNFWNLGEINVNDGTGEKKAYMRPMPLRQFEWGLKICAGAIMPSKTLAKDYEHLTPTYVVKNYPPVEVYTSIEKQKHDEIIIGWGGSLSHFQSFVDSGVLNAIKRICKKIPEVKLMINGDKRVYDNIEIPEDRKIFHGFVPYEQWPALVSNFDIGLAPLAGEYDKRRSWIKPLEYMLLKIPWLASDIGSYDEIREYGRLVKNRYDIWETVLLETINNLGSEENNERINRAYEFAIKQDTFLNVNNIINTFKKIIDKGYD